MRKTYKVLVYLYDQTRFEGNESWLTLYSSLKDRIFKHGDVETEKFSLPGTRVDMWTIIYDKNGWSRYKHNKPRKRVVNPEYVMITPEEEDIRKEGANISLMLTPYDLGSYRYLTNRVSNLDNANGRETRVVIAIPHHIYSSMTDVGMTGKDVINYIINQLKQSADVTLYILEEPSTGGTNYGQHDTSVFRRLMDLIRKRKI